MKPFARVGDRHAFDTIVDARSPAEFELDHMPGAINCPVLDNEERRIVGTLYKQSGPFEARRVGGAMVAANLARHLQGAFAERPANWRPLVYCWRGGLRSGSMTTWLRMVGWDAQQLAGGYKSWRRHVLDTFESQVPQLALVMICGATGSAKTRLLQALAALGEQVLDIEGMARHKGSLLGALPDIAQPSQTAFETALADRIDTFDLTRPVFVEGEGARIGQLNLPVPLVARMRASPCMEIQAAWPARLAYLLQDYAYLGDRPDWLATQLGRLTPLLGRKTIAEWQALAHARDLPALFTELALRHYDPSYERSQRKHFHAWDNRVAVPANDLSEAGIARLAAHVAALAAQRETPGR
ncbi:tRNA 2-selenouridine(34) synthase MnmH [Cupriavidus agavae]|uniref:tRNA 2-selenouridine synthase n=1 Tax=Cupriavidus agavae TaxID=1001822 RepID=A0A4Q7RZD2_9BURK|nr:tRNA 2-selenouridine(34) synthase MnmH [Cupriavidus agavae]RZT39234.1 tRNA 2-selenouridine synthase [Cupriavidus agavae]